MVVFLLLLAAAPCAPDDIGFDDAVARAVGVDDDAAGRAAVAAALAAAASDGDACDAARLAQLRARLRDLGAGAVTPRPHLAQLLRAADERRDPPQVVLDLLLPDATTTPTTTPTPPTAPTAPTVPPCAMVDVFEENDALGDSTDRQYTQGLRLRLRVPLSAVWSGGGGPLPDRPLGVAHGDQVAVGVFVQQLIYTPEDIAPDVDGEGNAESAAEVARWRAEDLPRQRPFGAWMAAGVTSDVVWPWGDLVTTPTRRSYWRWSSELSLGCAGGSDLCGSGHFVQGGWHHILRTVFGADTPREPSGWLLGDTTIDDALAVQLRSALTVPVASVVFGDTRVVDLVVVPDVAVGTVFDTGAISLRARAGQLASEFEQIPLKADDATGTPPTNAPALSPDDGWFVFGELTGRGVAYNRFIDNVPFDDGDLQGHARAAFVDATAGAQVAARALVLSFALTFRSSEIKDTTFFDGHVIGLVHVGFRL